MVKPKYSLPLLVIFVLAFSCTYCPAQLSQCAGSQHLIICVANDANRVCEHPSNVTTDAAGVSQVLSGHTHRCSTLYFASGLHVLKKSIVFRAEKPVRIIGEVDLQTIIKCNQHTLEYSKVNGYGRVLIRNVIFRNCSSQEGALVFVFAHRVTLENTTIQNSVRGVYAYNCFQIILRNCKFINNSNGHVVIFSYIESFLDDVPETKISIYKSLFQHGGGKSGLQIVRGVNNAEARCSVFHNSTNVHLSIREEDHVLQGHDEVEVSIKGCVFTESPYGVGIFQETTSILTVTISNCSISKSQYVGVYLNSVNFIAIERSMISNISGAGIEIMDSA